MSSLLSTFTEIAQIDCRKRSGTVAIPLTTEIPNRVITIKDTYGSAENSTITLITQGSDLFENGLNMITISNNFGSVTLYSGITNRWSIISASTQNSTQNPTQNPTQTITQTSINLSSLTTSTLFLQPGHNTPQIWGLTASASGNFGLQNISTATTAFTVDISSITRFHSPLIASTLTLSSLTLYDRGAVQMKNLQLSSAYLLVNGENISSIASGITAGNITSTVAGLGQTYISTQSLQSTVAGLGQSYISTQSLQSTVAGLGQTYISTQSLQSTVAGLGQSYMSTQSLQSTVQGLGLSKVSGTLGVNTTTTYPGYTMDINGPTQSAVYYSSFTAGGTTTITPANFGTFYNITAAGTYTLAFSASQPASNIGKYNCFRNNSGGSLSFTLTGVSGITSPLTIANAQSATFVVATTSTYALF
jgi:hypothetical protein